MALVKINVIDHICYGTFITCIETLVQETPKHTSLGLCKEI